MLSSWRRAVERWSYKTRHGAYRRLFETAVVLVTAVSTVWAIRTLFYLSGYHPSDVRTATLASGGFLLALAAAWLLAHFTMWFMDREDPGFLVILLPIAFPLAIVTPIVYEFLLGAWYFGAAPVALCLVILAVGATLSGQGVWHLLLMWPVPVLVFGTRAVIRFSPAL